ncbi:MAG TPA: hypothetical protein VH682_23765 [Gemmataceae bacterium]
MKTSRSRSPTFRPSLEVLETRDVPSVAGAALMFAAPSYISQSSTSANALTFGLENDFNVVQNNIQTQGWTSVTQASLAKAMSDFGFAEQTYNFVGQINSLLETGLLLGAAGGLFGAEDASIWLSTWTQLHTLDNTVNQDAGIANGIAHSPISTPSGQVSIVELAS